MITQIVRLARIDMLKVTQHAGRVAIIWELMWPAVVIALGITGMLNDQVASTLDGLFTSLTAALAMWLLMLPFTVENNGEVRRMCGMIPATRTSQVFARYVVNAVGDVALLAGAVLTDLAGKVFGVEIGHIIIGAFLIIISIQVVTIPLFYRFNSSVALMVGYIVGVVIALGGDVLIWELVTVMTGLALPQACIVVVVLLILLAVLAASIAVSVQFFRKREL